MAKGMRHFLVLDVVLTSFPVVAVEKSSLEVLVKTGKAGRISSAPVALVLSDVEKAGSGSSCQRCCAGWICVPELDGFSSEKNANADVRGNYPHGITGLHMGGLLTTTILQAFSTDLLSSLCWLGS